MMTLSLILILALYGIPETAYPGLKAFDPVFWLESVVLFFFGITWLTKGQLFFRDTNYRKGP
jgi:hypothetical protein